MLWCYTRKILAVLSSDQTTAKVAPIALFQIYNYIVFALINKVISQKHRRSIAKGMVLVLFWYDLYRKMRGENGWIFTQLIKIWKGSVIDHWLRHFWKVHSSRYEAYERRKIWAVVLLKWCIDEMMCWCGDNHYISIFFNSLIINVLTKSF